MTVAIKKNLWSVVNAMSSREKRYRGDEGGPAYQINLYITIIIVITIIITIIISSSSQSSSSSSSPDRQQGWQCRVPPPRAGKPPPPPPCLPRFLIETLIMTMHCNYMDMLPHDIILVFHDHHPCFCSLRADFAQMVDFSGCAGGEKSYMKYESESGFSFLIIVEICGFWAPVLNKGSLDLKVHYDHGQGKKGKLF